MKKFYIIILIILGSFKAYTQIITEKIDNQVGKKYDKLKPQIDSKKISYSGYDNLAMQLNTKDRSSNEPFQFGKAQNANISLNNGEWFEEEDGIKRWKLTISSKDAYSINLVFDKLYLADGAELYIYDENFTTIMGPITHENQPN